MRKNISKGYSILEIMVVIGIVSVLLGMAGLGAYYANRDNLLLEQAAQDLASEIRLVQSKIFGIQDINGDTPKAAVIKISPQAGENVEIAFVTGNCSGSPEVDKNFNIEPRAQIKSISPSGDNELYLVYTTPAGRFYSFTGPDNIENVDFTNSINQSCRPDVDSDNIYSEDLEIVLTNGDKDYLVSIDPSNGSATPEAI